MKSHGVVRVLVRQQLGAGAITPLGCMIECTVSRLSKLSAGRVPNASRNPEAAKQPYRVSRATIDVAEQSRPVEDAGTTTPAQNEHSQHKTGRREQAQGRAGDVFQRYNGQSLMQCTNANRRKA